MASYIFAGFSISDVKGVLGSAWQVDPDRDVDTDAVVFEI